MTDFSFGFTVIDCASEGAFIHFWAFYCYVIFEAFFGCFNGLNFSHSATCNNTKTKFWWNTWPIWTCTHARTIWHPQTWILFHHPQNWCIPSSNLLIASPSRKSSLPATLSPLSALRLLSSWRITPCRSWLVKNSFKLSIPRNCELWKNTQVRLIKE